MAPRLIPLSAGPVRAIVSPEAGGSLAQFAVVREGAVIDLMRPPLPVALADTNPRALASYPLVPFSNRIAYARFGFEGADYALRQNFLPEPHAIHGDGWQARWATDAVAADRVSISYVHDGPEAGGAGWPFRYQARQTIAVDDGGMTIEIGATNLDTRAWPFGCGVHPYFRATPGLRLTARLPQVWMWDTLKLPVARIDVPPQWDFSAGRAVGGLNLDHCFAGWDQRARLEWPEFGVALTIEADAIFGHLVIAALGEVFAVEPVSHANDGINLRDRGDHHHGLVMLEPGRTIGGRVRFALS
jgi:aldose 1-epimerase